MKKFSHRNLIYLSGFIWMMIGLLLLRMGSSLLWNGGQSLPEEKWQFLPLATFLAPYMGGIQIALIFLAFVGLFIGYFKGKFVLSKSAHRVVNRIKSYPNPTSLANIYSPGYYVLLTMMMSLGMVIKYLNIPNDIRGCLDIAIGLALLIGSLVYFRLANKNLSSTHS